MILYLPSIGCRLRNATGCNMLASGDHLDESGSSSHWVPKVSNISMVNILVQPVINLRVPPIITHLWWYWGWFVIGIATFKEIWIGYWPYSPKFRMLSNRFETSPIKSPDPKRLWSQHKKGQTTVDVAAFKSQIGSQGMAELTLWSASRLNCCWWLI